MKSVDPFASVNPSQPPFTKGRSWITALDEYFSSSRFKTEKALATTPFPLWKRACPELVEGGSEGDCQC